MIALQYLGNGGVSGNATEEADRATGRVQNVTPPGHAIRGEHRHLSGQRLTEKLHGSLRWGVGRRFSKVHRRWFQVHARHGDKHDKRVTQRERHRRQAAALIEVEILINRGTVIPGEIRAGQALGLTRMAQSGRADDLAVVYPAGVLHVLRLEDQRA